MQNASSCPDETSSSSDGSASFVDRAMAWLMVSERESRWIRWGLVFFAGVYLACLAKFQVGPNNRWGWDTLMLLDGGWRILNGQIPHRDFYLALGPLEDMLVAFGMLLAGGTPQGIAIGNAIFGLTVGIWGWILSRSRMPAVPAMLLTAWLILIATSPTPLGVHSDVLSAAMIYNRHGYGLLGIVLVECAFSSERSRFWGGFSTGVALTLLAFLKLNYFGVGALLLIATAPSSRKEMWRAGGVVAGIAATFAVFSMYLRFAIPAFLADMAFVLQAHGSSSMLRSILSESAANAELVSLAIFTVVTAYLVTKGKLWKLHRVRLCLLGCIVIGSGILFRRTNGADLGDLLPSLWTVVLISMLLAAYQQRNKEKMAVFVLVTVALGGTVSQFVTGAETMRTLLTYSLPSTRSKGVTPAVNGLGSLRFYDAHYAPGVWTGDSGHLYVATLNDGLALLENSSTQSESVMTLGMQNPFSYLLRRRPALGGSPWLYLDNNLSREHKLEASRVFGDAALIMVPDAEKEFGSASQNDIFLQQAYQPYLLQHFTLVARSQWWSLYRRNQ